MKHRLELISDGVFAIAMTLLVLELKVPEIGREAPASEIWSALEHLAPLFVAYLLAFVLCSVYWFLHTQLFRPLQQELDVPFLGLNTLLLISVSLLPFTLSLWEKWHLRTETIQLFLAHYALIALVLGLQAVYIRTRGWWAADHPQERLVRLSLGLPALAVGGLLGVVAMGFVASASVAVVPIAICVGIARFLSRRANRR